MFSLIDLITNLKAEIENNFKSRMKVSVEEQKIHLMNRQSYLGLVITPVKKNQGVVVNLSDMYKSLQAGVPHELVIGRAMQDIDNEFKKNMENYHALFVSYEEIRSKLIIQTVSTEANKEKLQFIPHMEKGDKSLIYRVIVSEDESKVSSMVITNELLKVYRVQKEALHVDAVNCTLERSQMQELSAPKSVISRLQRNQEQIRNEPVHKKEELERNNDLWKG